MKSFITISTLLTFSLFLANCSSSPEKAQEQQVDTMSASDSTYTPDPVFETDSSDAVISSDSLEDADLGSDQYADDDYGAEAANSLAVGSDLGSNRQSASDIKIKAGFYRFGGPCEMRSQPNNGSTSEGMIPANKRLWVDPHSSEWHIVHKKSGPVYISSDCI